MSTCQERRSAWCTLRLHVEVEQPCAFRGKLIDARRWRATEDSTPITADLTPAKVVPKEKYDVRLLSVHAIALSTNLPGMRSATPCLLRQERPPGHPCGTLLCSAVLSLRGP